MPRPDVLELDVTLVLHVPVDRRIAEVQYALLCGLQPQTRITHLEVVRVPAAIKGQRVQAGKVRLQEVEGALLVCHLRTQLCEQSMV
jgi:hypothetical protein